MIVTTGLVRHEGGWTEVQNGAGITALGFDIEGLIVVDHIPSLPEVLKQAQAQLDLFAVGQTEITVGLADYDDSFGLGDLVEVDGTERRVMIQTYSRDPDRTGRIIQIPQVGDVIDTPERRWSRSIKKMSNGTLGGTAKIASPIASISTAIASDCCPPQPEEGEG